MENKTILVPYQVLSYDELTPGDASLVELSLIHI